jgi:hypothetical protein
MVLDSNPAEVQVSFRFLPLQFRSHAEAYFYLLCRTYLFFLA